MVVLARLIPPAAFGIFAVVTIVQELAVTMPSEGIGGALVQRRQLDRGHVQAGFALSLGLAVVLTLLTVALAFLAVGPLFGNETKLLTLAAAPFFLLGAIYAMPLAMLRRRLEFGRISILDVGQNLARAVATVALALAGLEASALVFGSMIGMALVLVPALLLAPVPLPRWGSREARDLVPYGGPAALATVAWNRFRTGEYPVAG